ncbi:cupredoxin domain-containing protein [Candidatus Gottesmanbacteria bacterium]|nr:cupredoxin domain-containing protein [Candidatus Gottesmanbacteria bacterium]
MKKIFLLAIGIVVVIAAVRLLVPPQPMYKPPEEKPGAAVFETPTKSPHWVSNMPQHASIFAAAPINVVIDVDFDLTPPSQISILKDNKEYGVGQTTIDQNKLAMRRDMNPSAPNGIYTVTYKACWPDKSCHDGSFQFAIDRRLADEFEDHRGRPDIPPDIGISIENTSFVPKKIRIRRNTRVIWTNNDTVDHYINTDPHSTHTYFLEQNSQLIKPKEAYSVVFSKPGEYPYHCSAHPDTMTGSLLVEE